MTTAFYKAHPWHGVATGDSVPDVVNAYIEMVPTDTVKYEIDKETGHLRVDRPQKYSSQCPSLYGFIPRTYCGMTVAALCNERLSRSDIVGDGDPLDVCVLTEKPITHGDILVRAVPIGGLRMIDGDQADDKIIAVLYEDGVYGNWQDISECPVSLIERLRHYFLTYKDIPGVQRRRVEITHVYDALEAKAIITRSVTDYRSEIEDAAQMKSC